MSYTKNKNKVNAEIRDKIAKVFFTTFVAEKLPVESKRRQIVEETVVYILNWCLSCKEFKK
jgi:hypothetical protein